MSYWWLTKLTCSILLIASIIISAFTSWLPDINTSVSLAGRILVLVGGAIFLSHYWLIKRDNKRLEEMEYLVTQTALFKRIRHPIYFGEMFMMLGYALIAAHSLTLLIFVLGILALVMQAKVEDKQVADKFPQPYAQWTKTTKLILPYVY
ncbi:hypothetical protein A3715_10015 [Oleiphilus sp. HI0009]|nr:hypothetical protein A3715_10015 [Oleiphilus sp. HI0009]